MYLGDLPTGIVFSTVFEVVLITDIQYPSDWELQEESNDKLRFIKQEGFVTADLNVENLDESETTLSEYASTRVNELQAQRPEFQLISSEPITISNKPAQKVVYTFEREGDGKTNKVMRIWSINEGKLYTLAYIAESSQYDRYLPTFQRMVDSFRIGDSDSGSSTTQVQSSDGSREDNNGIGNCDRVSYPDPNICIPPYPPDLNCPDISYKNFRVTGGDPHGFDRDNDGFGCDSATENTSTLTPEPGDGDGCVEVDGYLLSEGSYLDERGRIVGSPCNPEEFCSDPQSTDPTVIDHCQDIWTDFDCGDQGMEDDPRCINGERNPCYFDPTSPECVPPTPTPTPEPNQIICPDGATVVSTIEECSSSSTPIPTHGPTPTPTSPTSHVDPSRLARSQPQCEFGVNPETGLCNTEVIPSEPLPSTPEPLPSTPVPTTTPEEEFSTDEEPEEEVEEVPEDEPEDDTNGNGNSDAGGDGSGEDGSNGNGDDNEDGGGISTVSPFGWASHHQKQQTL